MFSAGVASGRKEAAQTYEDEVDKLKRKTQTQIKALQSEINALRQTISQRDSELKILRVRNEGMQDLLHSRAKALGIETEDGSLLPQPAEKEMVIPRGGPKQGRERQKAVRLDKQVIYQLDKGIDIHIDQKMYRDWWDKPSRPADAYSGDRCEILVQAVSSAIDAIAEYGRASAVSGAVAYVGNIGVFAKGGSAVDATRAASILRDRED